MSSLADVVAAADPALRAHAVAALPSGDFGDRVPDPHRAYVLEAVREGFLLHYREPRAFAGMDPDLRLLAGDSLYALGLARLAEVGDLDGIAELSDLISLCARAHAEARGELSEELWQASTEALVSAGGPGASAAWERMAPRGD